MKSFLLTIVLSIFTNQFVICQNSDFNLLKKVNQSYTPSGGNFMTFITNTDDPVTFGIPGIILTKGLLTKNSGDIWNSTEMLSTSLLSSLVVATMKLSIKRDRPSVTHPDEITKYTHAGSYSFPSGHTSICFATATSVSLLYPKWYVIAPMFTWATMVGYSRMYLGVHYPSDVLVGAIVGSGSAIGTHYLFKYMKNNLTKKKAEKL